MSKMIAKNDRHKLFYWKRWGLKVGAWLYPKEEPGEDGYSDRNFYATLEAFRHEFGLDVTMYHQTPNREFQNRPRN